MTPPKSERNNDVEKSTELGAQYSFPIKGTRLLGEITDCRGSDKKYERGVWGSYCIKKVVKKTDPHSNGHMSKKKGMNFQWPKLEQEEPRNLIK